jgi:hypothetical protein
MNSKQITCLRLIDCDRLTEILLWGIAHRGFDNNRGHLTGLGWGRHGEAPFLGRENAR